MSIAVTGTVVDAASGNGLPQVIVEARGDWALTSERLSTTRTDGAGAFRLEIKGPVDTPSHPAEFRVRAVDVAGRPISGDADVSGAGGDQALQQPIRVREPDREGLEVTHLTGEAQLVSDDNALKLLIDGEEAFGRIAADVAAARRTVDMTQLFFSLAAFRPKPEDEHPTLVFAFGPPPLVPGNPTGTEAPGPHVPRPNDVRPERLLAARAIDAGVNVRILFNDPSVGWPEGVLWLAVLPPLGAGVGALLVLGGLALIGIGLAFLPLWLAFTAMAYLVEIPTVRDVLESASDVKKVRRYFEQVLEGAPTTAGDITVRGMREEVPDDGVLHCKMVIVDRERAVVVGSPFSQRYFDGPEHPIDEPRRGLNTAPAVHDVSVAVVGPAVDHLHATLRLYWNEEASDDDRIEEPTDRASRGTGEDGVARVQVIRTLSGGRFESLGGKSEKGILEAYLRAFTAARQFIYCETQYLTSNALIDGLVNVLTERPALEVILLVNIKPDVAFYPGAQARQIDRLREAGGDRVGVFTRWAYAATQPRPSVAQVYLHTKAAIVDDTWATIGSANLDGLSLDYNVALSPLVAGETTATELNISIVGGPDGPALAGLLRRRLWAEHLGVTESVVAAPANRWLPFWRAHARNALAQVNAGASAVPGFVLEFPAKDGGSLTTTRKHLKALGVDMTRVRPIGKLAQFDFFNAWWRTRAIEDTSE